MIDPGRMDSRAAFQSAAEVADGGGGNALTWSTQFTRWGALELPSLSAQQEAIAAGSVQSTTGGTLTVRDDAETRTISAGWRAVVTPRVGTARTWNIREVRPPLGDGLIRMSVETGVAT